VGVSAVKQPSDDDVKQPATTDSHARRRTLIPERGRARLCVGTRATRVHGDDVKPAVSRNLITQ